jgi:hypothetical protein
MKVGESRTAVKNDPLDHQAVLALAIAFGLACLGGAVWMIRIPAAPAEPLVSRAAPPVTPPVAATDDALLARTTARLAQLEKSVAVLGSARAASDVAEPREQDLSAEPPSQFADPAELDDLTEQRRALVADVLASEPRDREWMASIERHITAAVAKQAFANTRAVAVTCGSTVCEVQLEHEDTASFQHAADIFDGAPYGTLFVRGNPPSNDGTLTSVVLLSREGHALPE